MRVVYFHQHFSTPEGSTGNRSYWMARRLIERGHRVTMICGSYYGGKTGVSGQFTRGMRTGVVDGIEVIEYDLRYSNSDSFRRRASLFLRFSARSVWLAISQHYDVIFATSTPLTAAIPGIVARWLRRKTFVFEVRDLWPELPREMGVIKDPIILKILDLLELASYRSAHRLIGLAPGIVKGIESRGIRPDRITQIPNGCDLGIFESDSNGWRPHSIQADDLLVVYAGTHGLANGLDGVLDAALELKRRGCERIKFVLVGTGMTKQALQVRADREDLSNITFLDPLPKSELAGLFVASDIGLQVLANVPAFYLGTSPNKVFDYLAAGLPVLCNYPGWIGELINENECGFVVRPQDPVAFADALNAAAEDRLQLRRMAQNAKLLALSFDRDKLATKFSMWIEGAVNP